MRRQNNGVFSVGRRGQIQRRRRLLCRKAAECHVPLEINLYGMVDNRWYPRADFFRLAGEIGNEIVAGVDAHSPGRLSDPTEWERVQAFAAECGVTITQLPVERVLSHKGKIR